MSAPQQNDALDQGQPTSRLILRLLKLSWRYRLQCLKVFGFQMVLLALGIAGLSFTGFAVDELRKALQPGAPGPRWPLGFEPPATWGALTVILVLGGAVLVMAATRAVLNYSYSNAVGKLIHVDIVPNLRTELYEKLQRLSFRFFDAQRSGSIINRVTRDVQMLRSFVDGVLIQGAIMLLSLCLYLGYMLSKHVGLTLASLALTPLLWLVTSRFSRWARPAYAKNRQLVDDMVMTMAEGAEGAQVNKVFGREPEQHARFEKRNREVLDQQRLIFRKVSMYSPTVNLISEGSVAVVLLYGGWLVALHRLTLGDLIVFAGLLQQFGAQVRSMATIVNTLQQSLSSARRVFEVLDAPVEIQSPQHAIVPVRVSGSVRFEKVDFGFDPAVPVLKNVNLDVQAGRCVAILGGTGSGKSTLLSLIPRFYDPQSGRVLVDGMDVRKLDLDALRRKIGVVFQESLLFSASVADNIAFGHPEASKAQIVQAAKIAKAHDFIMELPKGYDTMLEAAATNLSGGQKQRIAIARALILEPSILLLDDPTASVDPDTEQEVLQAVDSATEGRTTFVVANRLSTLRRADLIVVMQEGSIAQMGTHEELMHSSGLYRRTAELQLVDGESEGLLARAAGAQ
jgi:ATP-binding cassette subfamily B protein